MEEIRLIKKEDIPNLVYKKLEWDVVVGKIPYQVIRVEGFAHCIGGKLDWGGGNNFWAYPLNETMSFSNLIEFDGHPGARWGLEYTPTNYIRNKYDETSIESGRRLIITRNGEKFYDDPMTIHEAMSYVFDNILDEHPLDLNERDYDKKCIGRKVWWRSQPAVITSFTKGRACVTIVPDGCTFVTPPEYADDDICISDNEQEIFTSIFDKHIYWFRD